MAVLIGDITTRTVVTDNAVLELDGAWDVHAIEIGGNVFAYVAAEDDDGISSFQLGPDGSLTNIENIQDDAVLELDDASNFASATIGGATYLYVNGAVDDGISVFQVAADGTLTNLQNINDDAILELDNAGEVVGELAVADVGGTQFLIAAGHQDDGFSVFRINANGTLTNTDNRTDGGALELDGAWGVATATVGGNTFVYVAGQTDDGISVFSLSATGIATNIQNISDNAILELDGVEGLTTAVAGGNTFVIAAGQTDDGVSVFGVDSTTGLLTNVFNVVDDALLGLDGATRVTSFVLDTETFVGVSGDQDDALTIFHLSAAGELTDVTTIFDSLAITLDQTSGHTAAFVNGVPILLATGENDDGVTTFDIGGGDDTLIGTAAADLILGLGGNDLLDGKEGDDRMIGGTGDDTYMVDSALDEVVEQSDGGTDMVRSFIDYTLGDNVENLELLDAAGLSGTGNSLDNQIIGNTGANAIKGRNGADLLQGKAGDDVMAGGAGKDELIGGNGKDDLSGNNGNDVLKGGKKADILMGGKGGDVLLGQGGIDDYVYTKPNQSGTSKATRDRIEGFGKKDDIDLSAIDAQKGVAGNQDFVLDSDGVFEKGEIRLRDVKAGVMVEMNIDNDVKAEMQILLKDFSGPLNQSDFIF